MSHAQRTLQREEAFALIILGLCFTYALVRYLLFGTTSLAQIPVYIGNKAVSWAAVACLAGAAWALARGERLSAKHWLKVFGLLSLLHVLLTVCTLSAATYPKLFQEVMSPSGKGQMMLTFTGEWTLLFGALAFLAFYRAKGLRGPWTSVAILASLGHLITLGYKSWFKPETWPGGLPPITLFSLLCVLLAGLMLLRRPRGFSKQGLVNEGRSANLA